MRGISVMCVSTMGRHYSPSPQIVRIHAWNACEKLCDERHAYRLMILKKILLHDKHVLFRQIVCSREPHTCAQPTLVNVVCSSRTENDRLVRKQRTAAANSLRNEHTHLFMERPTSIYENGSNLIWRFQLSLYVFSWHQKVIFSSCAMMNLKWAKE